MFNLILVDRGRLTNYLWGFIGCATWLIVVIMNHLVGDIFAQIFYVTMQFVGVWVWQRQLDRQEKNEYEEVNARMFTWWQGILAVIATIVIYLIVVFVSSHTGGVQVRLDGTLLPLGIVGQILMTYGYRSQWVAWITLDVIKVVIWFQPAFRRRSWRHVDVRSSGGHVGQRFLRRMGLVPQEQHYGRIG